MTKYNITTFTSRAILLIALLPSLAFAQLKVDSRHVSTDVLTKTMLATIPERLFGTDTTLELQAEDGWKQVSIAAIPLTENNEDNPLLTITPDKPQTYTFNNIGADSKYLVTCTANDGNETTDTLQFTFLPIVQLVGQTGYDYQETTFIYSHPDSTATDTLTAKVKWRGGTTNSYDKHKRNYKVKFYEDRRFFGLRNDNNWMLDAGQPDVFRLRNRIAMDIWNKMARQPYYSDKKPNARNGVRGAIVEVFLGDEYRGIYNFSEMMDRKQLKLNKTDAETGRIHGCLYKGVSWDKTRMFNSLDNYDNTKDTFYGYEMKYPELDDSDTIDWAPLVAANNFAHDSSDEEFQQHVGEYFDIPVVTDYNIFYNVVNAVDNAGKNMYWAIYDKDSTRCLTPTPWDLDATFGQRWGGTLVNEIDEGFYNSPEFKLDFELMLTYRFFRDNFNDYIGQLNERYKQLRQAGQPLHTDSILNIVSRYYQAVKRSGAASREEAKWSGDSDVWGDVIDFDTEYAYICDWIRRRMEFIDQTELPLFYKKSYFDELGISTHVATSIADDNGVYDLNGRKMNESIILRPGIYVRNGKKVIVK